VWYRWPWGIKTTIRVKHYIPDYVVSAYRNAGENSWEIMSFIDDLGDFGFTTAFGFGSGGGEVKTSGRKKSTNTIFKNVTAIGNPLASTWQSFGLGRLMCRSEAQSFVPAYASSFDWIFWRTNPVEAALHVDQIITQRNKIKPSSHPGEKWAFLYPRTGFVVGTDDVKAAAVSGIRASSIVTDKFGASMNVANRPSSQGRSGYWPPGKVELNNTSQGYFQMLLPKVQSSCGLIADMGSLVDKRSTYGNYAWNFWRPYECCSGSGSLIMVISF
jgi:integrating conjugative element protein (TIGR03756 family)